MAWYHHENAGRWRIRCLSITSSQASRFSAANAVALSTASHCTYQQLEQQALASLQHWGVFHVELNDLLTTRELHRWRLILGERQKRPFVGWMTMPGR